MAASMSSKLFGQNFKTFAENTFRRIFDNAFTHSGMFYRSLSRYRPKFESKFYFEKTKQGRKIISLVGFAGATRCLSIFTKKEEKEEDFVLTNAKKAKIALMNHKPEVAERLYHEALKAVDDKMSSGKMTEIESVRAKTYIYDGLADIAMSKDEFEKAETLYKETMKGCLQSGIEKTDNSIVELSVKLATIYAITGKDSDAIQGFEFAIETQKAKLEIDPDSDSDTRALLGLALESYGRFKLIHSELDTAVEMLIMAFEIARDVMGEGNAQTLILLNDIATAYIMKKEYLQAEKYIRETIVVAEEAGVPEIATFYCNLGSLFLRMSKLGEATHFCQKALYKSQHFKDIYGAQQATECLKKIREAEQDEKNKAK